MSLKPADQKAAAAGLAFWALASRILDKAPAVLEVQGSLYYDDYNDEYNTSEEHAVEFKGSHRDEDLDVIPEARRIERQIEGLLDAVPHTNDWSDGAQERVTITATRTSLSILVDDENEYGDDPAPTKAMEWDIVNGKPVNLRRSVRGGVFGGAGKTEIEATLGVCRTDEDGFYVVTREDVDVFAMCYEVMLESGNED